MLNAEEGCFIPYVAQPFGQMFFSLAQVPAKVAVRETQNADGVGVSPGVERGAAWRALGGGAERIFK